MEAYRTSPLELTERLDPGHYRPTLLENERKIDSLGSVRLDTFYSRSGIGHTAAVTPHYSDNGIGVPFINGGCIRNGQLEVDGAELVKRSSHDGVMRGSRLQAGFVLAVRKGELGNAAVVPEGLEAANCSSEVFFLEPTNVSDSGFLASYFNSCHGRMAFLRQQRGMMIASISLYDVPKIPVPSLDEKGRAYIGNKVRQAESLRAEARRLIHDATSFFAPLHNRTGNGWRGSWRRNPSTLEEGRLDAWFYAPAPTELEARLHEEGAEPLRCRVEYVRENSFDSSRAISYFEIGNLDVSSGCAWPTRVEADLIPSRAQRSVQVWDILVSTVRPERKNVALVGPGSTGQLVASSGFSVLRASTPEEAAFICWYLRSDAGTDQLLRWNTGAAYPAIDDDVPLTALIPSYEPVEIRRRGACWMRIPELLWSAKGLTSAARFLVEALIERRVSEADLIAAHTNPAADRALLERLTTEGFDCAEAQPLFPDLDRLEGLVATSRGEQA